MLTENLRAAAEHLLVGTSYQLHLRIMLTFLIPQLILHALTTFSRDVPHKHTNPLCLYYTNLTSWSTVLVKKLLVSHLVKDVYGTRKFIILSARDRH
jgi:hypothetical protein